MKVKAWKHTTTSKLLDIQTIPGPLPEGYNAEEWTLVNVTEAEIDALVKTMNYKHTPRGIAGLFETSTNILTYQLEAFV